MAAPTNRRVVLGVSGGIAAYKSPDLARRLRERGCDVRVVMTRGAREFITPLTLQAVSGNPVHDDLFDARAEAAMGHIELARWADAVLVAPASAHFLAKLAHGLADDLLSTLCLATEARIAVAPAMNQQMWAAAATRANVLSLLDRGILVFGPGEGDQACGETGPGRMLEPVALADRAAALFGPRILDGTRVIVTAGPTREALDPVRYITNHSSGKMGYAVAAAAAQAGARVVLVSGPTALDPPAGVERVAVTSAEEMLAEVMARVEDCDVFIAAAAVADYRPSAYSREKIKKGEGPERLDLTRTSDVLATVAGLDDPPFTVGFAAETEKVEEHARAKLAAKSIDLVAANRVGVAGRGFGSEDNALTVIWGEGKRDIELAPKPAVARELVDIVAERYRAKHPA